MAREEEAGRKHPAWESWELRLYSHTGLHICMPSNSPKDHARAESSLKALQGLLGSPRGAWSYPCPCCGTQQEEPAGLCQAGRFPPHRLAQSSALMALSRSRLCSWDAAPCLRHSSPCSHCQPHRLQELAQCLAMLHLTPAGVVALAFESHGHKKRRDLLAKEQPSLADAAQAPKVNGCSSMLGEDAQCLMWKCLYLEQYIVTSSH